MNKSSIALVTLCLAVSVIAAPEPEPKAAFSGQLALQHIAQQVRFGPRTPGHAAKQQTIDYIQQQLQPHADKWVVQPFQRRGLFGTNLWASFYAAPNTSPNTSANRAQKSGPTIPGHRIILAAHWDTRPTADQDSDKNNYSKPVIGANDGGSGVAVLLEIARLLSAKPAPVTVDLVFLDLEDMGNINDLPFSIGATEFVSKNRFYRPDAGVVVDMVCDRNLVIPREKFSHRYAPDLQNHIWQIAKRQGASAFVDRDGTFVDDDHLPFIKAGLPVVVLVHWPFPDFWHTTGDTIEQCSAESLQQVGDVISELIYTGPAKLNNERSQITSENK